LPEKLVKLQNEPYTRFEEILESDLIWTTESSFQNKIKSFKVALMSNARLAWMNFISGQQKNGFFLATDRYYIKRRRNNSAGGVACIQIFVTLKYASDAYNPELIRRIILDVINKYKHKWTATTPSKVFKKRRNLYKLPEYIWISLYQHDGPVRWVIYGGWLQRNLIAVAEKIRNPQNGAIFVRRPDEIWQGIRLQYQIDFEVAARSLAEMLQLGQKLSRHSDYEK
jgi:hypothetical protein